MCGMVVVHRSHAVFVHLTYAILATSSQKSTVSFVLFCATFANWSNFLFSCRIAFVVSLLHKNGIYRTYFARTRLRWECALRPGKCALLYCVLTVTQQRNTQHRWGKWSGWKQRKLRWRVERKNTSRDRERPRQRASEKGKRGGGKVQLLKNGKIMSSTSMRMCFPYERKKKGANANALKWKRWRETTASRS